MQQRKTEKIQKEQDQVHKQGRHLKLSMQGN